jgi:hypothetical protein
MLLSKRKRYLSGPDWVINTLDSMMKNSTCAGNMSQLVLLLDAPLAVETVRIELNRFVTQFPVLEGSVARDWILTPYWRIPASVVRDVNLTVSHHPGMLSAETFPRLCRALTNLSGRIANISPFIFLRVARRAPWP